MSRASAGWALPAKIVVEIGSKAGLLTVAPVAGVVGIEPTYGGIKTRCLTAWLHPSLYCSPAACSRRGRGVPVVDRETQANVAVLEIDPPRHEHRARIGRGLARELVALVCDSPESLLERGKRAVESRLRRGFERGIGEAEQPGVQARDREPPAHELGKLLLGVV